MSTEPVEAAAPRRRIKEMEVMVADVISETPDTATLVLFTGNDRLDYQPGHFLTVDPHQFESLERFTAFLEDLKGKKEPPRAYSMSSAPHEKQLAFTIKEERYASGSTKYPPLLSPLLVKRTARGARLVITGFTGPYTLPADIESRTDHVVHVCAGSGIVPNYSIIKHALLHHPRLRHTLVYSNRTWADAIFGRDLNALEAKHPQQLRVVHTLTRQDAAPGLAREARQGRLTASLLREVVGDPGACRVYLCGPAVSTWDKKAAKEKGVEPAPRF
ncbi:MAG TPA: oxidoreductase, partial [Candidatus Thermoplasmatota archaeon]